jgi:hypothetical protein
MARAFRQDFDDGMACHAGLPSDLPRDCHGELSTISFCTYFDVFDSIHFVTRIVYSPSMGVVLGGGSPRLAYKEYLGVRATCATSSRTVSQDCANDVCESHSVPQEVVVYK